MVRKKHLGLIIAFGPEVRSFIYSGLLERIAQQHAVTVFTSRPTSPVFQELPKTIGLMALPPAREPARLRRWRSRASLLHSLWLKKRGRTKWRHYLQAGDPSPRKHWALSVLASRSSVRTLSFLEEILARSLGTDAGWAQLYSQLGIDAVVASSYASERTLPALQTALNLGVKTMIVTNSWKDIQVKPHVPLKPHKILVWNDSMARLFQDFNPWLGPDTLAVSGSLHLGPFLNGGHLLAPEAFYGQTGLDPERPFLCYTAAAPRAVLEEEQVVGRLLAAMKQGKLPRRPQLLLRINPMEDGGRFASLASQHPGDLMVQRPRWEWLPEADWCCPLPEDLKLWVSTVHYAALNVSIPSTVTLEFASLGKPVVNICFDASPAVPAAASNRRFWFADFYSETKAMGLAVPSFSAESLLASLIGLLGEKDNGTPTPRIEPWLRLAAVYRVMASLNGLWA